MVSYWRDLAVWIAKREYAQALQTLIIQSNPKCGDCGCDLAGIPALRPRKCEFKHRKETWRQY